MVRSRLIFFFSPGNRTLICFPDEVCRLLEGATVEDLPSTWLRALLRNNPSAIVMETLRDGGAELAGISLGDLRFSLRNADDSRCFATTGLIIRAGTEGVQSIVALRRRRFRGGGGSLRDDQLVDTMFML